jgi:acetyl-CoA acetyltransferase
MVKPALSAIVGLGFSKLSRKPIGSTRFLATQAVRSAVVDAGIRWSEIDGLLLNPSALAAKNVLPLKIQDDLGLRNLRLLSIIEGKGSSVLQMIQTATLAIRMGMANTVACVFSDAPLNPKQGGGQAYQGVSSLSGIDGWEEQYGMYGPAGAYALLAQRYIETFGIAEKHFGAHALACRKWAERNPMAFLRTPLTMAGYLESRRIADPFRVLDCAYPVNGAAAVIVTNIDRVAESSSRPVYVHGMGQGHSSASGIRGGDPDWPTPGALAGKTAFAMAGVGPRDVSMCQVYDAFSYCAVAALEDYDLCPLGEGAAFISDGNTAPGGRLPVNTGGGQLASFYLQGMTPLTEAVIQGRSTGEARQVEKNDVILVNGSGGRLEYHAALIVSPHQSLG